MQALAVPDGFHQPRLLAEAEGDHHVLDTVGGHHPGQVVEPAQERRDHLSALPEGMVVQVAHRAKAVLGIVQQGADNLVRDLAATDDQRAVGMDPAPMDESPNCIGSDSVEHEPEGKERVGRPEPFEVDAIDLGCDGRRHRLPGQHASDDRGKVVENREAE